MWNQNLSIIAFRQSILLMNCNKMHFNIIFIWKNKKWNKSNLKTAPLIQAYSSFKHKVNSISIFHENLKKMWKCFDVVKSSDHCVRIQVKVCVLHGNHRNNMSSLTQWNNYSLLFIFTSFKYIDELITMID